MLAAVSAQAATFRFANDGDANSMDPIRQERDVPADFTQNFYDPLVRRDRELKLEPALAEKWEQTDPTTWRFHLRHGVKFQEGQPFTADDVVFSYKRAAGPGSQIDAFQSVKEVKKIDDYTVDFITKVPNPIMIDEITNWVIMSKAWCEEHNAGRAGRPHQVGRELRDPRTPTAPARSSCRLREPDRAPP